MRAKRHELDSGDDSKVTARVSARHLSPAVTDLSVLRLGADIPGLEVREHTSADAGVYYERVQANRGHLTQHGDYTELVASTREETERRFAAPTSGSVRCGI